MPQELTAEALESPNARNSEQATISTDIQQFEAMSVCDGIQSIMIHYHTTPVGLVVHFFELKVRLARLKPTMSSYKGFDCCQIRCWQSSPQSQSFITHRVKMRRKDTGIWRRSLGAFVFPFRRPNDSNQSPYQPTFILANPHESLIILAYANAGHCVP